MIVKKLNKKKHSIKFDSHLGLGSTFSFTISPIENIQDNYDSGTIYVELS